jgi:hypothetical protein
VGYSKRPLHALHGCPAHEVDGKGRMATGTILRIAISAYAACFRLSLREKLRAPNSAMSI